MLFAPTIARFALSFGSPEYFTLCLVGLFALSRVSGGSLWKGLVVLGLGLALGTVGMEQVSGKSRYVFGVLSLMQGIDIVPVAMGLFGVAEVLCVAERQGGLPQITRGELPGAVAEQGGVAASPSAPSCAAQASVSCSA